MDDNTNKYKSNIWKFYLVSILGGFTYFYNGIETLYYRHFNLSFEQIGFLISSMLLATLLLEIPTGSFADLYGRKKSILIASIFGLLGITLLAFGSTFEVFAAGFISLGASRAFSSGAGSALLYDSLHSLQKADDFIKHRSRLDSSYIATDLISGTLGFLIFAINVRIPYYISLTAWILVFIVQLTMYEPFIIKKSTTIFKDNLTQMKRGLLAVVRHRYILWLTFFSFLFFISGRFFSDVISTPFLQEDKQFSIFQLSILFLITNSIQTCFVFFAHFFEKKLGSNLSFLSVLIVIPLTFFIMIISNNYLITGIIIGIYYATLSFSEIITENYLNKNIDSSMRATVLSVSSMIISTLGLLILPLLGNQTDKSGLTNSMTFLATATLIIGFILLLLKLFLISSTKKINT